MRRVIRDKFIKKKSTTIKLGDGFLRCVGFIWSWSLEDIGRMGGFFEISLLFSREGGLNALLEGCLWLEM